MRIAKNVFLEGNKLIFKGINKRIENCEIEGNDLVVYVNSVKEARETYKRIAKILMNELPEKVGFKWCEVMGYRFLIYLEKYRDGIEKEMEENPLSEEFDIACLPNDEGYYYSTAYGLDNVNVPAILVVGSVISKELSEIVDKNLSLTEMVELKKISDKILKLSPDLLKLAENLKKIESIENILKKILAVRFAFTLKEYSEVQKVRRLGNGLCIYLSKKVRNILNISEGDLVTVRVVNKEIILKAIK